MPSKVDEYSKTSQKVDARSPAKASLLAPAYLSIRAGQERAEVGRKNAEEARGVTRTTLSSSATSLRLVGVC